nr:twitching motility protein PilT [Streptomyces sp. Z38]
MIAIDNDDRRMWARHSLALEDGRDIHVPSVVVSQAWRDSRRQVRLGKFLAGCHVVPVGLETAKAAGVLCGKAGTADIVDATVVVMAASLGAIIWTSDPYDIRALIDAQDVKPAPVIRTV